MMPFPKDNKTFSCCFSLLFEVPHSKAFYHFLFYDQKQLDFSLESMCLVIGHTHTMRPLKEGSESSLCVLFPPHTHTIKLPPTTVFLLLHWHWYYWSHRHRGSYRVTVPGHTAQDQNDKYWCTFTCFHPVLDFIPPRWKKHHAAPLQSLDDTALDIPKLLNKSRYSLQIYVLVL